jgi:hypothetical protein
MSNLKLNNVLATGENTFIVRMTFSELKDLVNFETIIIDLKKEVPYVPLEDEGIIYLNIDKDTISYNNETKEFTANDKFRVLDGEIRLINFINCLDLYKDKMNQIVTLNIVCCDINKARNLLSSIDRIAINREAIQNIANEIMNPYEEVKELISKIRETRDTIEGTDEEYFDIEDLKILSEECSKLSLVCNNTIMLIKESEE